MANPDPERITDEMWRLWTDRPNPSWKLGGIFANKKGYHNTVFNNLKRWPDHYSIKLPLDLVKYNRDKARALDLTMNESEMKKWTKRMRDSALNPADNRLAAVKEFYGTLDGKTVYGLSKNSETGEWRRSSADSTHLWHGHLSIFTAFVANWSKLSPLLSVWKGESLTEWRLSMFLPKLGEKSEEVKYWQYVHNMTRKSVEPDSPQLEVDGEYGPTTNAAFQDFWKKTGGKGTAPNYVSGWLAMRYHRALAIVSMPIPKPVTAPVSTDEIKEYVNQWLSTNVPTVLEITGSLDGKVQIK